MNLSCSLARLSELAAQIMLVLILRNDPLRILLFLIAFGVIVIHRMSHDQPLVTLCPYVAMLRQEFMGITD